MSDLVTGLIGQLNYDENGDVQVDDPGIAFFVYGWICVAAQIRMLNTGLHNFDK
jgi:hypothetical protein